MSKARTLSNFISSGSPLADGTISVSEVSGAAPSDSPSFTGNITVSGTVDGRDLAADGSKLDGIESGATADQTASEILTAIKTVDGSASGLDADLLDGQHATAFATAAQGALADSAVQPGDNISTLTNNSGYITGNQTITLSGDVSGSGTTSIAVTVADDSHNHVISNVDGLQAALDGKLSTSGKAADSNLLDGIDSSAFLRSNVNDTFTGDNITFGPNISSRYLYIGGTGNTATVDKAAIAVTNGNLHIDAAGAYSLYLNYYKGTGGIAFGNGAGSPVAWMGSDGDLWKGSSDNSGSKYWHAGNDGAGSGLDADLLDGQQGSYYYSPANPPPAGGAVGGGSDQIFFENDQVVTTSYTITSNSNAVTTGPITISSGATITINDGQRWVIV